jgi:hypothetical protein
MAIVGRPKAPLAFQIPDQRGHFAADTTPLSRRPLVAYLLLCAALLAVLIAVAVQQPWSGDLGMHLATLARLRNNFTHPGDPLVDASIASPYYSPYTLLLDGIARTTGAADATVLAAAGPVNVALFFGGLYRFVNTLTPRRYAPCFALICVLVLWGFQPILWSGFISLWALPLTMCYPSTAATALTLLLWSGLARGPSRPLTALGLGVLLGVIGLTHPFAFVIAAIGAAAIVVSRRERPTVWLAAAAAVTVSLLAVWPYYPFFALFRVTSLDSMHAYLYSRPLAFYGLALLALPALARRLRRDRTDPLVLLCAAGLIAVGVGALTGRYSLGRLWPAVMLAAQLALGIDLCERARRKVDQVLVSVPAIALVFGFAVQGGHLALAVPQGALPAALVRHHQWPDYAWLRRYISTGDVIVTDDYDALRMVPAFGGRTIPPAWPDPFLTDQSARWSDVQYLHAPQSTMAERRALIAKYHPAWILEIPGQWSICAGRTPVATGPQGQRLFATSTVSVCR